MSQTIVTRILVDELFGIYSYVLPRDRWMPNAAILYGQNGIGKSTILLLLFHMLSSSANSGHRTAMSKVPFRRFVVELSSGIILSAERHDSDLSNGPLDLTIKRNGRILSQWVFDPKSPDKANTTLSAINFDLLTKTIVAREGFDTLFKTTPTPEHPFGRDPYLEDLAKYSPTMFFIGADRRLESDSVADADDEIEFRRTMLHTEPKSIQDLVARARELALNQAMSAAARWIARKAVQSTNQGSTNAHTVYSNVVRQISGSGVKLDSPPVDFDIEEVRIRLDVVETISSELAKYEFSAPLSMSQFRKALTSRSRPTKNLVASLANTYLEGVESRIDAIQPLYIVVSTFIDTMNKFLSGKRLHYTLSRGFSIITDQGLPLSAGQLSSGEQQLILLFCYSMIARDHVSVFIIDEPEISLNVRWQRDLMKSLLDITSGTSIQFVLASHSMELMAKSRENIVTFENNHASNTKADN